MRAVHTTKSDVFHINVIASEAGRQKSIGPFTPVYIYRNGG